MSRHPRLLPRGQYHRLTRAHAYAFKRWTEWDDAICPLWRRLVDGIEGMMILYQQTYGGESYDDQAIGQDGE